jgi:tRNA-2-methylthio-N6-dimethylallyladenosine synthase
LAGQLRAARPDLALSTDVIVGFPGETEDDFARTLALVEELRFAVVYAFKYSPRPGTAAPRLDGAIDAAVADERLQRLFALQEGIQRELNAALAGQELDVVVTGWGKEPGFQTGRTPCHRVINFPAGDSPAPLGAVTRVRVEQGYAFSLLGVRVARVARAARAAPVAREAA